MKFAVEYRVCYKNGSVSPDMSENVEAGTIEEACAKIRQMDRADGHQIETFDIWCVCIVGAMPNSFMISGPAIDIMVMIAHHPEAKHQRDQRGLGSAESGPVRFLRREVVHQIDFPEFHETGLFRLKSTTANARRDNGESHEEFLKGCGITAATGSLKRSRVALCPLPHVTRV